MPGGRPPKYNPDLHPKLVYHLASKGMTDSELAIEMGIDKATVYLWSNKYAEFRDARKSGKEQPDDLVEAALFTSATGYRHTVKKQVLIKDQIETLEVEEAFPPNPTSMIFYLKNRRPEKWKDKQEVEHSGEIAYSIIPAKKPNDPT